MENTIEQRIKSYIAPILLTILGVICLNMITEIRSDVKSLLAAKAETSVKVSELERRVNKLEYTFSEKLYATKPDELKIKSEKNINN